MLVVVPPEALPYTTAKVGKHDANQHKQQQKYHFRKPYFLYRNFLKNRSPLFYREFWGKKVSRGDRGIPNIRLEPAIANPGQESPPRFRFPFRFVVSSSFFSSRRRLSSSFHVVSSSSSPSSPLLLLLRLASSFSSARVTLPRSSVLGVIPCGMTPSQRDDTVLPASENEIRKLT